MHLSAMQVVNRFFDDIIFGFATLPSTESSEGKRNYTLSTGADDSKINFKVVPLKSILSRRHEEKTPSKSKEIFFVGRKPRYFFKARLAFAPYSTYSNDTPDKLLTKVGLMSGVGVYLAFSLLLIVGVSGAFLSTIKVFKFFLENETFFGAYGAFQFFLFAVIGAGICVNIAKSILPLTTIGSALFFLLLINAVQIHYSPKLMQFYEERLELFIDPLGYAVRLADDTVISDILRQQINAEKLGEIRKTHKSEVDICNKYDQEAFNQLREEYPELFSAERRKKADALRIKNRACLEKAHAKKNTQIEAEKITKQDAIRIRSEAKYNSELLFRSVFLFITFASILILSLSRRAALKRKVRSFAWARTAEFV